MRFLASAGSALGLLFLSGCSTFESDWRAAQTFAHPAEDISGCWEGTWESETSGRHGKLRAIITRQDADSYDVEIRTKYARILPVHFEVPVEVHDQGGFHLMQGEADLGWMAGGVFTYTGQSDPREFVCTYREGTDQGIIRMTRHSSSVQCSDNGQYCDLIEFANFVKWADEDE